MKPTNGIWLTARAVIIHNDQILLCRNLKRTPPDFWVLPGGAIEHGEAAANTVIRELKEELNLSGTVNRFLGCYEQQYQRQTVGLVHDYAFLFHVNAQDFNGIKTQHTEHEHIECHWFNLEQLDSIDVRPVALKKLLPLWLSSDFNDALKSDF